MRSARIVPVVAVLVMISSGAPAREPFKIGDIAAKPGEMASGYLSISGELDQDRESRIPVTVIHGTKPGPVLALIAGMHPTEYCPILALLRMRKQIDPKRLSGSVILVHIANMRGFISKLVQDTPASGKNLNRCYPGKPDGDIKERIAYTILTQVIERADYVIDMHSGPTNYAHLPLSLVWKDTGNKKVDRVSREMALVFGIKNVAIESLPKDPAKCGYTDCTANLRGKPAFSSETGQLGETSEKWIGMAEQGVWNVLTYLKMWPGKATLPSEKSLVMLEEYVPIKSPVNGIFYPTVKPGQKVSKGDPIGVLTDFFGKEIMRIKTPAPGIICSLMMHPPAAKGEGLADICTFPKKK